MQAVTAVAAGLNAQSLHHAMPSVGCAHFPRLYDEYAAICARHNVPIRSSRHFGTAVGEMVEYMFDNNAPESRAAKRAVSASNVVSRSRRNARRGMEAPQGVGWAP